MEYYIESHTLEVIVLIIAIPTAILSLWLYVALKPRDYNPSGNEIDTDYIQSDLNIAKAKKRGDLWIMIHGTQMILLGT